MPFRNRILLLTLFFIWFVGGTATARDIIRNDACTIESGDIIEGTLFTLCRSLQINGTITGNLIGVATDVMIDNNARIEGNVYIVAGQLDVIGTIGHTLHYGGAVLTIHPQATFEDEQADIIAITLSTVVSRRAMLPDSIIGIGYQMVIQGVVEGEVNYWGSALGIDGQVNDDVYATVGDITAQGGWLLETILTFSNVELINPGLRVSQNAEISGVLNYTSPTEAEFATTPDFMVNYTPMVGQNLTQIDLSDDEETTRVLRVYLSQVAQEFIILTVVGVAGLYFMPQLLQAPIGNLRNRPLTSLGIGLLSFIMGLVTVVVLIIGSLFILFLLSLVSPVQGLIALGLVLGLLNLGGVSLFVLTAIVARVVVCLAGGRIVLRKMLRDADSQRTHYLSLLLGIALLSLVGPLPFIGWLLNALAMFLGFGAILIIVRRRFNNIPDYTPEPVRPVFALPASTSRRPADPVPLPQQLIDPTPPAPGMDNLPEGFEWWDDD